MTAKQRAELKGYVSPFTWWGRAGLFLVAGGGLAWFGRALVHVINPAAHYLWWTLPALAVMGWLFVRARRWTGGPDFRRHVRADLGKDQTASHLVEVAEAIAVEEAEDEGPAYFLRTRDGRVMVLAGQYLDAYRRRGFPWQSFEIVEAPESQVFFRFRRMGGLIAPSFRREPFSREEFRLYGGRKHQFITADFEGLKVRPAGRGPDR